MKNYFITALCALIVGLGAGFAIWAHSNGDTLGAWDGTVTHTFSQIGAQGGFGIWNPATNQVATAISSSGIAYLSAGAGCVTASWNPPALGTTTPSNVTSTDIVNTNAVLGDLCSASLTSATTSGAGVNCLVTANGTTTLRLSNSSGVSLDLATGTAKTCIIK